MWWEFLIAIVCGAITGAALFMWGYNMGYAFARSETSFSKYLEAMGETANE